MEALITALGKIPKWFSNCLLLLLLVLSGVVTYSVTRTIVYDCGTVELAGTVKIGNHCQNITTTDWRYLPWTPPEGTVTTPDDAGFHLHIPECLDRAKKAGRRMDGVGSSGVAMMPIGTVAEPKGEHASTANPAQAAVFWYKIKHKRAVYDVLYQCLPTAVLVMATGPFDQESTVKSVADIAETAFVENS